MTQLHARYSHVFRLRGSVFAGSGSARCWMFSSKWNIPVHSNALLEVLTSVTARLKLFLCVWKKNLLNKVYMKNQMVFNGEPSIYRYGLCLRMKSAFLKMFFVTLTSEWTHDLESVSVMRIWYYWVTVTSFIKIHPCILETGEKMLHKVLIWPYLISP